MMKLMHVDASAKAEWSNSRALSKYFIHLLHEKIIDLKVDYLDLAVDTPPHVTEAFAIATYIPEQSRSEEMKHALIASDALCKRVLDADLLVLAMPMYNWTIPSTFKAFIDSITRMGVTFISGLDGSYVGQLNGKKVLFITTRGGDLRPGTPYASMDALTPVLKAAFGFLGVSNPIFIDAQPLQFANQEARSAALIRARDELVLLANEWATSIERSNRVSEPSEV
jgi:FMN-dependent NADH-azoreductase